MTVSISSASVQEDLMTEILHIASSSSVPTACHAEAGLLLVQQERSAPCDDQPVVTGAVLFHAEADERDFFDLPDLRCLECGGWGPCGGLDDDLPATPPDDGGTWGVCIFIFSKQSMTAASEDSRGPVEVAEGHVCVNGLLNHDTAVGQTAPAGPSWPH